MKKLILLLLLSMPLSAQTVIDTTYVEGKMYIISTPTYKGVANGIRSWFCDGKLHLTQNFSKGLLHGKEFFYYPNGKIEIESTHSHGVLHGEQKIYDERGNVRINYFWYGTNISKKEFTELRRKK